MDAKKPLLNLSKGKTLVIPVTPEQQLSVTDEGMAVLNNEIDWLEVKQIDRWIGGVHLSEDNIWRWDQNSKLLVKQ